MSRWTDDEIKLLKQIYSKNDWEYILKVLDKHTKDSIIHKAYSLKIRKENFYWNENDIRILKESYDDGLKIKDIAKLLDNKFSEMAIYTKANTLGICQKEKWTKNEIELLKIYYPKNEISLLESALPNRNRKTIIKMAQKLHIKTNRLWSDYEEQLLLNNYLSMSDLELSKMIGRSEDSIRGKRDLMHLTRQSPGIYNSLSEYLRKRNIEWKKQSAINCSFKCVISGKRFNAIHHLYGMNLIIKETLERLHIDPSISFDSLSSIELKNILDEFLKIQAKYPLGVCLTDKYHKMFHNIYGYGNNTEQQYNEFLNTIKHNIKEYPTLIKTA